METNTEFRTHPKGLVPQKISDSQLEPLHGYILGMRVSQSRPFQRWHSSLGEVWPFWMEVICLRAACERRGGTLPAGKNIIQGLWDVSHAVSGHKRMYS